MPEWRRIFPFRRDFHYAVLNRLQREATSPLYQTETMKTRFRFGADREVIPTGTAAAI
jgi:hypothetical protein